MAKKDASVTSDVYEISFDGLGTVKIGARLLDELGENGRRAIDLLANEVAGLLAGKAGRGPAWDTTVKLGAIEEASYATVGAVIVAVDKTSGELTLRKRAMEQPHGRSREVVE